MATVNSSVTPWFATTQLTSPELRYALAAAFASGNTQPGVPEGGCLPGGGTNNEPFTPTSNGSAGAPSVLVQPGQCVINRSVGGTYICTLPSATTVLLDLPLPSSGNTRIDLLVGEVVDPEADSAATTGTVFRLRTITGTPAASPTAPAVPANTEVFAQWVVNNAGAITAITSRRRWTRSPGGVRLVESGDTRGGSYTGDLRMFKTGQVDAWFNNAWLTIIAPSVWIQQNVSYIFAGNGTTPSGTMNFGTGGTSIVRYKRAANDLHLSYAARWGTGVFNGGCGRIWTTLPNGWTTPAGRDQWITAQIWVNDSVSGVVMDVAGLALIKGGANAVEPFFPKGGPIFPFRIASTQAIPGDSIPWVQGGYAQGGAIHLTGTIELAA